MTTFARWSSILLIAGGIGGAWVILSSCIFDQHHSNQSMIVHIEHWKILTAENLFSPGEHESRWRGSPSRLLRTEYSPETYISIISAPLPLWLKDSLKIWIPMQKGQARMFKGVIGKVSPPPPPQEWQSCSFHERPQVQRPPVASCRRRSRS